MAAGETSTRDTSGNSRQLLPPGQNIDSTARLDHETAPADMPGSFLVKDETTFPVWRMPTDEQTGLPHPILPVDLSYMTDANTKINYHHHFYNRRHPDLEGEAKFNHEILARPEDIPFSLLAGLAVRVSRGQRLPMELHNMVHREYQTGPELPHTVEDKFMTALKACSGIVSRYALDVTAPKSDRLVYMDDETFARVASPDVLCGERDYKQLGADHRRRVLGNFFLRYAISKDLGHVAHLFDEFLHTTDDAQRVRIGNFILGEAIEQSIAPVVPLCKELKKHGLAHQDRRELRATVWGVILNPDRRQTVHRVLAQKLTAA